MLRVVQSSFSVERQVRSVWFEPIEGGVLSAHGGFRPSQRRVKLVKTASVSLALLHEIDESSALHGLDFSAAFLARKKMNGEKLLAPYIDPDEVLVTDTFIPPSRCREVTGVGK